MPYLKFLILDSSNIQIFKFITVCILKHCNSLFVTYRNKKRLVRIIFKPAVIFKI